MNNKIIDDFCTNKYSDDFDSIKNIIGFSITNHYIQKDYRLFNTSFDEYFR